MKKIILSSLLFFGVCAQAFAANDRPDPSQSVIKSSVTIMLIEITSHTWTQVPTTQMAGSFTLELQNPSTSWTTCCTFDNESSTDTTKGAIGKACRIIPKDNGTWVIQRWWRDLTTYCRVINTNAGNSTILATQGK